MNRIAILGLLATLLVLPGCPNKNEARCEKMADRTFEMAKEIGLAMAKMMGAEKAAEMEKEMSANWAKERPAIITSCLEAVNKDPEIVEVMDCMIGAADLEAASKCDPDGKLAAMKPKKGE